MMSQHFALSSELTGTIAKKLPHAKNYRSMTGSFFNQFVPDMYIHKYIVYILTIKTRLIYICVYVRTNLRNQQLCIIVHLMRQLCKIVHLIRQLCKIVHLMRQLCIFYNFVDIYCTFRAILLIISSALRLLALRVWRTLCVRRRLPSVAWR